MSEWEDWGIAPRREPDNSDEIRLNPDIGEA